MPAPVAAPAPVSAAVLEAPAGKSRWPRILLAAVAVLVVAGSVAAVVKLTGRDGGTQTPLGAGPASSAAASPAPSACGFTDGFGGATLAAAWQRTRTNAALTVAGGTVTMDAPDGSDTYEKYLDAPRLLRPVTGNFVAQADVTARPRQFYQGAGLVLWAGADHYARVERGYGQYGEVVFEYKNAAKHKRVLKPGAGAARSDADRVVLELAREGSAVRARWRPATETAWRELGSVTMTLPAGVQVGVSVLNRAQGKAKPAAFSASFDSVTLTC
jgi:regulation of enolase protein 1 (concanavalin A-like superfamily)